MILAAFYGMFSIFTDTTYIIVLLESMETISIFRNSVHSTHQNILTQTLTERSQKAKFEFDESVGI